MPRKRHFFPVDHDINDDGKLWEMTDEFGDRSIRFWLEICSILDKTENRWEASDMSCKAIFRKTRIKPATGWQLIGWLLARHLLATPQAVANRQPPIYGSPNFWKFHRSAAPETFLYGSLRPTDRPDSSHKNEKNPVPATPGSQKEESRKPEEPPKFSASDLVQEAIALGGTNPQAQQKLAQWVVSMTHCQQGEPTERVYAVTKASIEGLRKQLAAGKKINDMWGYLTEIFKRERTKFIQEVEHPRNKAAVSLENIGAIFDRLRVSEG